MEKTVGTGGTSITTKSLSFSDIVKYAEAFPDDVDDLPMFVRCIQAIDQEFQVHGLGPSKTRSSS